MIGIWENKTRKNVLLMELFVGMLFQYVVCIYWWVEYRMWNIAKGSIIIIVCINCLFRYESALKLHYLCERFFSRNSICICICIWIIDSMKVSISFNPSKFASESIAMLLWQYNLLMWINELWFNPPKLKISKWKNLCKYLHSP